MTRHHLVLLALVTPLVASACSSDSSTPADAPTEVSAAATTASPASTAAPATSTTVAETTTVAATTSGAAGSPVTAPANPAPPGSLAAAPAGALLPKLLSDKVEAASFVGEPLGGACQGVDTQMKCVFGPSDDASPIKELMVDCNSIFSFDDPSPRMMSYPDEGAPVEGIGSRARFRTSVGNPSRSEFELELADSPVSMCSLQMTFEKNVEVDPAAYLVILEPYARRIVENIAAM